ncbi:unnamed protein product [Haemonchus placei]|uniref:CCHC-type domain-containing protein n=1 Tax=Haemonchus placei TaxID=6290 RepID=A0A0N4WFQ1_HAEPC|nr:unnamed protein product [Haemonchus placei]
MRNRQSTWRAQTIEQKRKPSKGPARKEFKCRVCGASGHAGYECFRKQTAYCKVCKKKGYLAASCWKSAKASRKVFRQVHWCEEPAGSSDNGEELVSQSVNMVVKSRLNHCRRAGKNPVCRSSPRRAVVVGRALAGGERACGRIRMVEAASTNVRSENEQNLDKGMIGRHMSVRGEIDRLADEPPRMLDMEVNGIRIPFELDTGASLSIIDERTWHKLGRPHLQKPEIAATAFGNKRIMFQGKVPLQFRFAGKEAIIDVHVFREASHSLCGSDMIRKLQIDCGPHYDRIHSVAQMSKVAIKKELVRILNNSERLFQEGLGKCTTSRAELKFKN